MTADGAARADGVVTGATGATGVRKSLVNRVMDSMMIKVRSTVAGTTGNDTASGTVGDADREDGTAGTPVERLVAAVRAGRAHQVPKLFEPLTAAERKSALAQLKAVRSEVRSWDWKRWNEATAVRRALYVAGAGCQTGAAAAATWLGGRDLLSWRSEDGGLVLSVLGDRDAAWMADVALRLAQRPAVAESSYGLIRGLVERSGCAVPATDGYVLAWTREITDARLQERLREDPQTTVLVPHALAMAETPDRLTWSVGPEAPTHWPTALAGLVAEGVLDRAQVVDLCVSRLLRGGRPRDLRFPLEVLRLVEPSAEERRGRVPDWTGMAADAPSPVAGYAQEVLAGLAAEGALSTAALAEMTGGVLFRTEKKLVRAQLTLVGKVLAREPGAAGELLPAVAEAFGHEDTTIQERALKLVARHVAAVDASVRDELAGQAGLLSPVHRAAAAALFGEALEAEAWAPYEEVLPPVPEREPVAPPATTVEALVEELLTRGLYQDPAAFERTLDGLVRVARQDRAGLEAAVREAFPTEHWENRHYFSHYTHGAEVVLAGLLGVLPGWRVDSGRGKGTGRKSCHHEALSGILDARLWEAAALIGSDALPFLLAAPTVHTGEIDPVVLVERLRAYRDAGVEPAPADFAQALLRVGRGDSSAGRCAEEAEALGTRAGGRLAAWLRTAEPLATKVRFLPRGKDRTSGKWWLAERIVVEIEDRPVVRKEFPAAFRWLGGELGATPRRCYHWLETRAHWVAALPVDREFVAACVLPSLASGADADQRGVTEPLTALAEAAGPVGRALPLALAAGLGCQDADDRLRAVDALLVLASRGDLDARRLGTELAWLVAEGSVKPNRLADALRTAAATGAYGTVWAVLAPALPELLGAEKPVRGLGEVLAVAADCVERCGAGDEVAGLAGVASARGSSQFLVQAKRLLGALRQGAGQPLAETA
ncbi:MULTISPECIES: DUF7824 domain-containing protein [Streptomyces]|uniref:DUF7824 domain-containing protein n=2 Tax=Streptomyces venezuelae TaxID=54571 RepID=F2RA53_STRVP|nr:DUF6493 family protein [Streptomyces venezuelae]CCA54153.1 hypothetical protein SVEN_0866 [Streptomyces venezuelae ATCC 10712]